MYQYEARVERVVDGDTVDVSIDLGFDVWIKQRVRLARINAYESRTSDPVEKVKGLAAKKFVELNCPPGKIVHLNVLKWEGKYGRCIADVHTNGFGAESLNDLLVANAHAVYHAY